jgi:hypothetical protein
VLDHATPELPSTQYADHSEKEDKSGASLLE